MTTDPHDSPHEHIAKLKDVTLLLDLTRGELEVPHLSPVPPCDSLLNGRSVSLDYSVSPASAFVDMRCESDPRSPAPTPASRSWLAKLLRRRG